MTDKILECRGISKRFSSKLALDCVSLEIGSGKIIGLLGPNGSGKTTLIKLANGLIQPTAGEILIGGMKPSPSTKSLVSYLPDRTYFADWMKVRDVFDMFEGFYSDFNRAKADSMAHSMGIMQDDKIKTMSKGTKEKVQLILTMSRNAMLYLLDEPIAGVDPAARDFILTTIINNYNPDGTVIISTHLISDIERILDEVVFIRDGQVILHDSVDSIKEKEGKSIDEVFRDSLRMYPSMGGEYNVR